MDMDQGLMDREYPIEFQGIELRGLNESGLATTEAFPFMDLAETEVNTSLDIPLRVYTPVTNAPGRTSLLTFHDIGTNHNSFLGFFNFPEMQVLMQHFNVYHVCAPGHQDMAGPVMLNPNGTEERHLLSASTGNIGTSNNAATSLTGSVYTIFGRASQSTAGAYPSLDEMADMLDSVVSHFNINYFVGFGMGAGSNVLARYTMKSHSKILGLFLLNPCDQTHGYYQWLRLKWYDLPQLRKGIYPDNLLYFLENHWFGTNQCDNPDVAEIYEQHLRSMNAHNVAGYIQSYIDRTDLGLVRELLPSRKSSVRNLHVECCLVSGEKAQDLTRVMCEMNGRMDPEQTQYLIIPDSTGMIMEENPSRLAYNFLNFLRTIGLVITLSPEKLKQKTMDMLQQNAMLVNKEPTHQLTTEMSDEAVVC
jgi:pimeloyl-ACP methyl ester carboxylesterase